MTSVQRSVDLKIARADGARGAVKPTDDTSGNSARLRWAKLAIAAPLLLALLMAGLGLRNVSGGNAVFSDASRHAMNGVMIYDFLRSGDYGDPLAFAKEYYQTYPATSLPYHAPLLPMIEALFFAVLGVNLLASRLVVSLFAGVMAFVLYKLVRHTHHSDWLAVACVLVCFALPICHILTTDVMLEVPSMAVALWAIYQLRDISDQYSMRRALAFAVIGGLAVWTKQHTVFVGVVPFAFVLISGKWSLLLRKEIWISSAVFGAFCVAMLWVHKNYLQRGFASQFPANTEYAQAVIVHNSLFYSKWLVKMLRPGIAVIVGASIIGLFAQRFLGKSYNRANDLYFAWAAAAIAVPVYANQYDERYVFYAIPALTTVGWIGLNTFLQLLLKRHAATSLAAGTAVLFVVSLMAPTSYLTGPAQVADVVTQQSPRRVLYCGLTDGAFVFAMRSLANEEEPVQIVRGDKIPIDDFQADRFPVFVRDYGIDMIVLERTDTNAPWNTLLDVPLDSMKLLTKMELKCRPYTSWNGDLSVYQMPTSTGPLKQITPSIYRLREND